MKELKNLRLTALTNLEFGQHIKSVKESLKNQTGNEVINDPILLNYITATEVKINLLDKAMVKITKSDETAKIEAADVVRDMAYTAAKRYLMVYELSENEQERLAFESIHTVFTTYGDIPRMNLEKETNAIVNLLTDLRNSKYIEHIQTLSMAGYLSRLDQSNTAFQTVFESRTEERSNQEYIDTKLARSEAMIVYNDMIEYVLSIAKATNSASFEKALNSINTIRTYYDTLLAKRTPSKKGETTDPIAPFEG